MPTNSKRQRQGKTKAAHPCEGSLCLDFVTLDPRASPEVLSRFMGRGMHAGEQIGP